MPEKKKMSPVLKVVIAYVAIIFASFLFALSTYMFLVPAKLIPGGVTGIASMIQVITGFPAQYSILIINVPILICALIFLEKKVAIRSIFAILCISGWMQLFSLLNMYRYVNDTQPLISAIMSGVLTGVAVGILINVNSSSGGTELTGIMIQKKLKDVKVSYIIFVINFVSVTVNAIVFLCKNTVTLEQVFVLFVCSIIQNFINSKSVDLILNGLSSAVKFEIVTKKAEEVTRAILREKKYSITTLESKGGYFEENSKTLVCVVSKLQISNFKKVVRESDPSAFMFSIETKEVLGRNFKKKR